MIVFSNTNEQPAKGKTSAVSFYSSAQIVHIWWNLLWSDRQHSFRRWKQNSELTATCVRAALVTVKVRTCDQLFHFHQGKSREWYLHLKTIAQNHRLKPNQHTRTSRTCQTSSVSILECPGHLILLNFASSWKMWKEQ